MKNRNINLDVIRCIALFYILCVHFFLNANFYYAPITGSIMKLGVVLRNCFAACVPLFIILTGYLMNRKKVSGKFYLGITKVLTLYGLSCIPIWIFRVLRFGESYDLDRLFASFIGFELYGWYIGLYLCLYMILPFLNVMYHGLETRKKKLLLVIIFVIFTAGPSFINKFGLILIPTYWEALYPITYYFIGAYLSEYAEDIKLKALPTFGLYVLSLLLGSAFVISRATDQMFYFVGIFVDWGNLLNTCSATLLFLALLKCDFSKLPKPICKITETISLVSLQLYLVSWIFDTLVYERFITKYTIFSEQIIRMPIPVLLVFFGSLVIALIIHLIYQQIQKISTK